VSEVNIRVSHGWGRPLERRTPLSEAVRRERDEASGAKLDDEIMTGTLLPRIFALENDGKPTLVFGAKNLREAHELYREEWLRRQGEGGCLPLRSSRQTTGSVKP